MNPAFANFFVSIAFLSLISCHSESSSKKNTVQDFKSKGLEFEKIVFFGKGCFGQCPIFLVRIDNNHQCGFEGFKFTNRTGYQEGGIDSANLIRLEALISKIDFENLDSVHFKTDDSREFEFSIWQNGKRYRMMGTEFSSPDELDSLVNWMYGIEKKIKVEPSEGIFNFEPGDGFLPSEAISNSVFPAKKNQ